MADCSDLVLAVQNVADNISATNSILVLNLPAMVTGIEGIEANTQRIYEYLYHSASEKSITDILKELQPHIEKISELSGIGVSTAGIRSALYDDTTDTNLIDIAIALQPHIEKISELSGIGVSTAGIRSALYDDITDTNLIDIAIALQPYFEKLDKLVDINTNTEKISRSLYDEITDTHLIDTSIECAYHLYYISYFSSEIMNNIRYINDTLKDALSETGITYNMIRYINDTLETLETATTNIRNILSSTLTNWSELGIADIVDDKLNEIADNTDVLAKRQIGMEFHTKSGTTLLDVWTSDTVENKP